LDGWDVLLALTDKILMESWIMLHQS